MTAMASMPDAVAFDCDGTIADTESLSVIAWSAALASRGMEWTQADRQALIGRPFAANWAHFSARGDLGDIEDFRGDVRVRFRALFDAGVEVHDDVVSTMQDLHRRGIGIAVVSSSTRDHIDRVLDRAAVTHLIADVVASGDAAASKPAPDPYLLACDRLGVAPERTAGVEDTTVGARSSRSAGLWTVAVRRAHAPADLDDHADVVVDHLRPEHLLLRARPSPGDEGVTADRTGGSD
jgi:HAD superfamily hydrolase (TIGR01509 family)